MTPEMEALTDERNAYRDGYNRLMDEIDALKAGNAVSDRREIDALRAEIDRLAEALARCRDMAPIADKAQEAAQ